MIKWFLFILLCVPRILYSQIKLKIMMAHKDKYSLQDRYDVVRNTCILVCKLSRRRYNNINQDVISTPHDQGRVYVSNHFNVWEAVSFIEQSKKPLVFISKIENVKVPFLYTHMMAIGTLCIDRDDIRQSLRICREAGKLAKEGQDIVIFAEGHRSKTGNVAPFKAALPTIIHYSETEIVLICVYKTQRPLKFRLIRYKKENVYMKFFEPLPYSFYLEHRKDFNEVAHDMIQKQLDDFRYKVNNKLPIEE